MEVSVSTSKRKFQSLLDNISNAAKNDPLSKHGKKDSLRGRPIKRTRLSHPTLRKDNAKSVLTESKPGASTEHEIDRDKGNKSRYGNPLIDGGTRNGLPTGSYMPWNRDAFLSRLKTFADPHIWTSKPEAINELQWVKRGWICEDKETLACKDLCGQRLVIDLSLSHFNREEVQDGDWSDAEHNTRNLEDTIAEKYKDLIVDAHSEHCLWRKSGCKEDVYRLPLLRSAHWKSILVSNYESLVLVSDQLPIELSAPQLDDLEKKFVYFLPPSLQGHASEKPSQSTAFSLALFGWKGELVGEVALARCESCFQRIGLWLYNNVGTEIGKQNNRANPDHLELLDPIASHKYYCPWVNADTQCASNRYSGKAGWEIMQDMIMHNHAEPKASNQIIDEEEELKDDIISTKDRDDARLSKLQHLKKIFSFKKNFK